MNLLDPWSRIWSASLRRQMPHSVKRYDFTLYGICNDLFLCVYCTPLVYYGCLCHQLWYNIYLHRPSTRKISPEIITTFWVILVTHTCTYTHKWAKQIDRIDFCLLWASITEFFFLGDMLLSRHPVVVGGEPLQTVFFSVTSAKNLSSHRRLFVSRIKQKLVDRFSQNSMGHWRNR